MALPYEPDKQNDAQLHTIIIVWLISPYSIAQFETIIRKNEKISYNKGQTINKMNICEFVILLLNLKSNFVAQTKKRAKCKILHESHD